MMEFTLYTLLAVIISSVLGALWVVSMFWLFKVIINFMDRKGLL